MDDNESFSDVLTKVTKFGETPPGRGTTGESQSRDLFYPTPSRIPHPSEGIWQGVCV